MRCSIWRRYPKEEKEAARCWIGVVDAIRSRLKHGLNWQRIVCKGASTVCRHGFDDDVNTAELAVYSRPESHQHSLLGDPQVESLRTALNGAVPTSEATIFLHDAAVSSEAVHFAVLSSGGNIGDGGWKLTVYESMFDRMKEERGTAGGEIALLIGLS